MDADLRRHDWGRRRRRVDVIAGWYKPGSDRLRHKEGERKPTLRRSSLDPGTAIRRLSRQAHGGLVHGYESATVSEIINPGVRVMSPVSSPVVYHAGAPRFRRAFGLLRAAATAASIASRAHARNASASSGSSGGQRQYDPIVCVPFLVS